MSSAKECSKLRVSRGQSSAVPPMKRSLADKRTRIQHRNASTRSMERYEVDDGDRELARHAGGENDAQLAYNPVASCRRRLQIMKRTLGLGRSAVLGRGRRAPGFDCVGRRGHERRRRDLLVVRAGVTAGGGGGLRGRARNPQGSEPIRARKRRHAEHAGLFPRKLGRLEAAFGYYREALAIKPRHLGVNKCLGAMRTLDWLKKSSASVS